MQVSGQPQDAQQPSRRRMPDTLHKLYFFLLQRGVNLCLRSRRVLFFLLRAITPAELLLADVACAELNSQALVSLLQLGVAQALCNGGSRSTAELAQQLNCAPQTLQRLLAYAQTQGWLHKRRNGTWTANRVTRAMLPTARNSMAPFVQYFTHASTSAAIRQLPYVIATGHDAYTLAHGMPVWDYFATHPDQAQIFAQAMVTMSSRDAAEVAVRLPAANLRRLCDVGGGHGTLLAAILQRHAHLDGSILDRSEALRGAPAWLHSCGVRARVSLVEGDFFAAVPAGYDGYLLRNILHDWSDADALRILRNCAAALRASNAEARLFIVETLLTSDATAHIAQQMDLTMLVATTRGQQRSLQQTESLLAQAGLRLVAHQRLASPCHLLSVRLASQTQPNKETDLCL